MYTNEIIIRSNRDNIFSDLDVLEFRIEEDSLKDNLRSILNLKYLREESFSILYMNGKKGYALFRKNTADMEYLKGKGEINNVVVEKCDRDKIFDNILLQLLIHSIPSYENDQYVGSNIDGKYYIIDKKSFRHSRFQAFDIRVNKDFSYNLNHNTISIRVSNVSFKETSKDSMKPKYILNDSYHLFPYGTMEIGDNVKIYERIGYDELKGSVAFYDERHTDRSSIPYIIRNEIRRRFSEYISFDFYRIEDIRNNRIEYECDPKFNLEQGHIKDCFFGHSFNIVDNVETDESRELIRNLSHKLKLCGIESVVSDYTLDFICNIVVNHNKAYYESNRDEVDPYKLMNRERIIQCITIEDCKISNDSTLDESFMIMLKELLIKYDLSQGCISLDSWKERRYEGSYTFVALRKTRDKRKEYCFKLTIDKDGYIFTSVSDVNMLEECDRRKYESLKNMDDFYIEDDLGNVNSVIDTGLIVMPSERTLEKSSGKEWLEDTFDGTYNVNRFTISGVDCYNCGLRMEVNPSLTTYKIQNASHIYSIKTGGTRNIVDELLRTMTTPFVKYGFTSIMPFPIKYLREFIESYNQVNKIL